MRNGPMLLLLLEQDLAWIAAMASDTLRCLLLSPLATGADATSLADYTGAEFGCVLQHAIALYPKANKEYSFEPGADPADEELRLRHCKIGEETRNGSVFTSLYALALLRFASPADLWVAEERLRGNFPRLYMQRIEERRFHAIVEAQNRCLNPDGSARNWPRRGWDTTTDETLAETGSEQMPTLELLPANVRRVSELGLPLHHVMPRLDWQFPYLQHRVASLQRPDQFWALCAERRGVRSRGSRLVYDILYILEEAARRNFHTCAEFSY